MSDNEGVSLARMFIGLGATLLFIGVVLSILSRFHVPIGRLPGDIIWRGKNTTVYFPWVTCLVLSLVLTALLWVFSKPR